MKFFIDTASLKEIREAESMGILDGVTTNPSLVAKEGGVDFHEHIRAICQIVNGPVSAEVTATDTEGMLKQGRELAKLHPNVTVKVPLTKDGLKACKTLRDRKSTRLNSSHQIISYAVFCLKKKNISIERSSHTGVVLHNERLAILCT